MFLRNLCLIFVTALPVHAAYAVSCEADLGGRAVEHAIAKARTDQKDLRQKAISAIAKFNVYVPVSVLNETRAALTEQKALIKTIRSLRDVETDEYQSQQRALERRLETQFRTILAHPKNQSLFKLHKGKEIQFRATWDMELTARRSLPLETRVALTALALAANNLALDDSNMANAFMEASAVVHQYHRAGGDINQLRKALKTPMGKMTQAQLQDLLAALEEQKKAINAEFLDQAPLPEPLQNLLKDLTEKANPNLDFLLVQGLVHQVEKQLGSDWELTQLITNGMLYYTSDMEKEVITKGLRRIVVQNNRARLMPEESAKRLSRIEDQIKSARLILSKIKE